MTTFVLVGGAWIGAWAWQEVAQRLRAQQHSVYPISLTGLAERVHLASPDVNLDTHITDVTNLLIYEDLHDVVLVGHSYGGAVVTGVANRVPERLSALVYCDAGPLPGGQAFLDLAPPEGQAATRATVAEHGDGWRLPFPPFDELGQNASLSGLDQPIRERMRARATAQPFGTYTQPLELGEAAARDYQLVVIACEDGKRFLPFIEQHMPTARVLQLDTGHWPMLSRPAELAALLGDIR